MAQLRQDYAEFTRRNTEVLVVCPDDRQAVAEYWRKEQMPMPGLVDPGHEVATQYGQRNNLLLGGRLPAIILLDRTGAVRFEHRGLTMASIPTHGEILARIDALNAEASARQTGAPSVGGAKG